MEKEEILEFYKKTSPFTDLGYYKKFAELLPPVRLLTKYLCSKQDSRTQEHQDDGDLRKDC